MGLNLGDVIVDDGDLYGEGINIAARLQALAQPGGITLSDTVREHVAGKLNVALEDLGPMSLKNIERPIRVFAIQGDAPAEAGASRERIGICVLPFANISGDPEQDYFSAGVTEDIIIDLSKLSSLTVVSRATSFSMKAQSTRAIAQQLNVAYVLEGNVRKAGERIRLSAQLIDGANDATVWAECFDRDIKDVLVLQSDLAKAVVEALRLRLLPSERQALERYAPTDPEAYKLFLLAREYSITGSERHLPLIIRLCRRVTTWNRATHVPGPFLAKRSIASGAASVAPRRANPKLTAPSNSIPASPAPMPERRCCFYTGDSSRRQSASVRSPCSSSRTTTPPTWPLGGPSSCSAGSTTPSATLSGRRRWRLEITMPPPWSSNATGARATSRRRSTPVAVRWCGSSASWLPNPTIAARSGMGPVSLRFSAIASGPEIGHHVPACWSPTTLSSNRTLYVRGQ
jgi:TolB-like protein